MTDDWTPPAIAASGSLAPGDEHADPGPIITEVAQLAADMLDAGYADPAALLGDALHRPVTAPLAISGQAGTLTPDQVSCPDCFAPAATPCRFSASYAGAEAEHAARRDSARLRSLEHGTCALCGHPAVRGVRVEGGPLTAWHHLPEHQGCPPMPDPNRDWNAYAAAINAGREPGILQLDDFRPADPWAGERPAAVLCPECVAGKHQNCDGRALHPVTDAITACTCTHGDQS